MSRYTHTVDKKLYAWGYDEPMSTYFFQCIVMDELTDEVDEVEFSVDSYFTTMPHPKYPNKQKYSNGEMLELMSEYDFIPREHLEAVALDLTY